MYRILNKEVLSDFVKLVVVQAPLVATKALAGQFVIVRINEVGERIPLTIADSSPAEGTITLIFQEVGKSTMQMGLLEVGDGFENVVGPLGRPTEVKNYGKVVLVGGGVGVAPLFPIVRALKEAGNTVISIIGARTKALLFWEERMRAFSDRLIVCTDDGSYGRPALVTEPLKELLESDSDLNRAWAIGPAVMMKFVAETTRPYNVPTLVSLNTIMIDGTGMCGGCRVVLDNGAQFVCVDGPEFNAHRVDWSNLLERLFFYRSEERLAVERWQRHVCNLDLAFEEMVR
ncbi:MAG: sulfide/dihydroorotate dehydrogenase-like FAD/NAD-binding protein [Anaerolineales bacterium]